MRSALHKQSRCGIASLSIYRSGDRSAFALCEDWRDIIGDEQEGYFDDTNFAGYLFHDETLTISMMCSNQRNQPSIV
jgi:hypothetical protein